MPTHTYIASWGCVDLDEAITLNPKHVHLGTCRSCQQRDAEMSPPFSGQDSIGHFERIDLIKQNMFVELRFVPHDSHLRAWVKTWMLWSGSTKQNTLYAYNSIGMLISKDPRAHGYNYCMCARVCLILFVALQFLETFKQSHLCGMAVANPEYCWPSLLAINRGDQNLLAIINQPIHQAYWPLLKFEPTTMQLFTVKSHGMSVKWPVTSRTHQPVTSQAVGMLTAYGGHFRWSPGFGKLIHLEVEHPIFIMAGFPLKTCDFQRSYFISWQRSW